MRSLSERPHEAAEVFDLVLLGEHKADLTKTSLLQFQETASGIPIFGSRAVVELDDDKEFVQLRLRLGHYLERRGLPEREAENSYLAGGSIEAGPMEQLLGSSITYRIAVGPQQIPKVFTLQTLPASGWAVRILACIENPEVIEKILTHLQANAQ